MTKVKCGACNVEPKIERTLNEWVVKCENKDCLSKPKLIMNKSTSRENVLKKWKVVFGTPKEQKLTGKDASRNWAWRDANAILVTKDVHSTSGRNTDSAHEMKVLVEYEQKQRQREKQIKDPSSKPKRGTPPTRDK